MEPSEKKTRREQLDPLPNQRHLFDLPKREVYLNCSGRSPMLKSTCVVGQQAVAAKLKPWTIVDDHVEEEVRGLFARLVNGSADDITFQASTSSALSLVAANLQLQPGQRILLVHDQMSSNVYPWQHLVSSVGAELAVVGFPCEDLTQALLEADWTNVKVCAIAPCHWSDGSLVDLELISKKCAEVGAVFVVDATQAAGVMPLDVAKIQPDFLCASVHKWLFGPYGICLMYCHPRWHAKLKPLDHHEHNRQGANGDDCLPFEPGKGYSETFKAGARRVDVGGRPNPILFPMLKDALTQVLSWGVARLEATLAALTDQIATKGAAYGLVAPRKHAAHLVGLRLDPSLQAQDISIDALHLGLKDASIHASSRCGALRFGVHCYNTPEDITALFEVLGAILANS